MSKKSTFCLFKTEFKAKKLFFRNLGMTYKTRPLPKLSGGPTKSSTFLGKQSASNIWDCSKVSIIKVVNLNCNQKSFPQKLWWFFNLISGEEGGGRFSPPYNVWFIKIRTIHKLSLWLYYDFFGKSSFHIANFSCQDLWNEVY